MIYRVIDTIIALVKNINITYYTITTDSPWEVPHISVSTFKKLLSELFSSSIWNKNTLQTAISL